MPTFDTPAPVQIRLDVSAGSVRVRASDRPDTVVTVRPGNDQKPADVQAAEQTRVTCTDGRLEVSSPRRAQLLFIGSTPSVEIELLGPNGAGKTTLVDILATLSRAVLRGRQPAHRPGEPSAHGRPPTPGPAGGGGTLGAGLGPSGGRPEYV